MENFQDDIVQTKDSRRRERLEKLKELGFDVYYSLSRSTVRQELLLFLKAVGKTTTMYDASKLTKLGYTNIKLAVIGDDRKYKRMYSLVNTGLVCFEEVDESCYLTLTDKGVKAALVLEASR